MYCNQCGKITEPGAQFCGECGAPLGSSGPVAGTFSPAEGVLGGPDGPVKTYLTQSIIVTLCCCQLLGIVAIIFSALAHSKNGEGKYAEAADYARKANLWGILAFAGGLLLGIAYAAMIFLFPDNFNY
jgi:hypothetical protein